MCKYFLSSLQGIRKGLKILKEITIVEQTPDAANIVNRSLERIPKRSISKELHSEMQSYAAYSISVDESSPELRDAMEENKIQIAPATHLVDLNKKAEEKGN